MKQVSVAIINNNAPFDDMAGKEAQDLAAKDYLKTYEAFSFYDIEHLYVCENSLNERHIEPSALLDIATVITPKKMSSKLAEHHAVYTF